MDDIADRASSDDSGRKFATAEANYSLLQRVYGLAQCTPDISNSDCNTCLQNCISTFPTCCNTLQGARIVVPSCYVRYETYPFYNANLSATLLPASPPPPSTTTTTSNPGKTFFCRAWIWNSILKVLELSNNHSITLSNVLLLLSFHILCPFLFMSPNTIYFEISKEFFL